MSANNHPSESTDRKRVVLVVEDVVLVRLLISDMLRSRGFEVVEAAAGEEAIRVLQSNDPVHAVLTDIYMPAAQIDGLGLAQWIRLHRPDVKVLLGSGVPSAIERAEKQLIAGSVLAKPYNFDELERRLRDVLA